MKPLPDSLSMVLSQQGAGTAICLRIFLEGGRIIGLTDHDEDLTFSAVTHRARPGLSLPEMERTADLAPDSAVIETALSSDGLTREDLSSGQLKQSRAEIVRVAWEDPAQRELVAVGTVGEVERRGDTLLIEFRGLAERLAAPTGRVYQKSCDAALGDERCGIDLAGSAYEISGQMTSASGVGLTIDAVPSDPEILAHGHAVFPDGSKHAIRTARQEGASCIVTLWRAPEIAPDSASSIVLRAGCNKRFETCRDLFANTVNFRGFPTIPGTDVLAVQKSTQG